MLPVQTNLASAATRAVGAGSSDAASSSRPRSIRCSRPPVMPSPREVARPQTSAPQTPRTPRTKTSGCASPVWTPRNHWTARTPQQQMLQWKAEEVAEKQELSECLDALYRHRKSTLRFLRRCEDEQDLNALQTALDPQPRRILPGGSGRGPVRATPLACFHQAETPATPVPKGYESYAAPAASLMANSPRLAWPARAAHLNSSAHIECPASMLTPRQPVAFAFAAPVRASSPSKGLMCGVAQGSFRPAASPLGQPSAERSTVERQPAIQSQALAC